MINAFAQDIYTSVQQMDTNLFALYSKQENIEALMKQDMWHDFFVEVQGYKHAGFCYGETNAEADQNAEMALRFAEKAGKENCVNILMEDKELRGTFPQEHKQQRHKRPSRIFKDS